MGPGGPSLGFQRRHAEKAREPIRNKALLDTRAEALRDVERRDDGFVPPAQQPARARGRHGRDDPKPTSKDDARPQPVLNNARDDAEKEASTKSQTRKRKAPASRRRRRRRNRRGARRSARRATVKPPGISFLHHQLEEA